jgi:hypothetical protein
MKNYASNRGTSAPCWNKDYFDLSPQGASNLFEHGKQATFVVRVFEPAYHWRFGEGELLLIRSR